MRPQDIAKTMFRDYDIRGRVSDDELNPDSVRYIAMAFGTMMRRTKGLTEFVVGYDSRECSEGFRDAVIAGLNAVGCSVTDIGLALSPVTYFAQYHLKREAGIMITGSHNPPGWSGFKLCKGYSSTVQADEIQEIYRMIVAEDFETGSGSNTQASVRDAYIADLTGRVNIQTPLKVVVDAGNGTAGIYAPDVLRRAGLEIVELYCDLDVNFPNHFPNPSNLDDLADLRKTVVELGADAGVAFDGDGDRIGLVDAKGNIIFADRILIILARHILRKQPGAKVVFDVKCSQALVEDIAAHGGVPIMWRTGHSFIKARMRDEKCALAGERSGHIFFAPDWNNPDDPYGPDYYYGYDDALLAALRTLEYVASTGGTVGRIMADVPQYITSAEIHVEFPDTEKHAVVAKLVEEFKAEYPDVIDIDGARVNFGDGWGLVRASSNLPELVLVFEAKSQDRLAEIKDVFRTKLHSHGVTGEWKGDA